MPWLVQPLGQSGKKPGLEPGPLPIPLEGPFSERQVESCTWSRRAAPNSSESWQYTPSPGNSWWCCVNSHTKTGTQQAYSPRAFKGKGTVKPKGKGFLLFNIDWATKVPDFSCIHIYLLSLTQSSHRCRERETASLKTQVTKGHLQWWDGSSYYKYYLLRITLSICKRHHDHTDSESGELRSYSLKFN